MKLNVETPANVVDISSVDELRAFDTSGQRELMFGAPPRVGNGGREQRLKE
jgi:xanthine dehydrogenase YagS FAD-binding subunit